MILGQTIHQKKDLKLLHYFPMILSNRPGRMESHSNQKVGLYNEEKGKILHQWIYLLANFNHWFSRSYADGSDSELQSPIFGLRIRRTFDIVRLGYISLFSAVSVLTDKTLAKDKGKTCIKIVFYLKWFREDKTQNGK